MADDFFAALDTLALDTPVSGCGISPDVYPVNTAGPFTLGQNYPNPVLGETTVPFTLTYPADVFLAIFDPQGRKVAGVVRKGRGPGAQSIKLNLQGLGLPTGDYVYQMQITSRHGTFRQSRLMTAE